MLIWERGGCWLWLHAGYWDKIDSEYVSVSVAAGLVKCKRVLRLPERPKDAENPHRFVASLN